MFFLKLSSSHPKVHGFRVPGIFIPPHSNPPAEASGYGATGGRLFWKFAKDANKNGEKPLEDLTGPGFLQITVFFLKGKMIGTKPPGNTVMFHS